MGRKNMNEERSTALAGMEEEDDTLEGKYLTFPLGSEEYGLEIRYVTEIVGIQRITEVPDMPSFIRGVINLRGKVIPVMDVRARFNLVPKDFDDHTCIIVVNVNNTTVGLLVDTVSEVMSIPLNQIDPPPMVKKGESSRYLQGLGKVGDNVKILLDIRKLLFDEEIEQIAAIG
jgi:purine-binding chemotaxis protein CheW